MREPQIHFDTQMSEHFILSTAAVIRNSVPLMGIPGSVIPGNRAVLLALPTGPLLAVVKSFERNHSFGGLGRFKVLRSNYWRAKERMLLTVHDRAGIAHAAICTFPWWTDAECEVWAMQQPRTVI